MDLRETISKLAARIFQQRQAKQDQAATTGVLDARAMDALQRDWDLNFGLELDRQSRYTEFTQMDGGDGAAMLNAIVAQALKFEEVSDTNTDPLLQAKCFKLEVPKKAKEARQIFQDVLKSTQIREKMPEIARDMVKYGDEFDEIVWIDDEIVGLQPHKVQDMYVNTDVKGRLITKVDRNGKPMAYQQRREDAIVVAGWQPYEMVHLKLFPTAKDKYSRGGFFDIIRWDWKKLNWLEQGMVLARATRAYPRLIWKRDMTGKTTMDATKSLHNFILSITTKRTAAGENNKAPMTPDEDYFIGSGYTTGTDGKLYPKLDDIQLIDPSLNGLGNIQDLTYQRRKQFNIVPGSVVGIFDNNQGDMTPQDIAYARFVGHVQEALERGLRTLLDRALIAKGIDPDAVQYRVIWPRTTIHTDWRYADGRFRNSMADANYMANGIISRKTIRMREFGMTDDESAAEEAQIEKELQSMATLYPTNSGQGQGEGSGNIGPNAGANADPATAQQQPTTPPQASQQAKSRTGGQNNAPAAGKMTPKTKAQVKKQQEAVLTAFQRYRDEQLRLANLLPPPVPASERE